MNKMKKGISAPLGLIFGVIIAIVLVLLAVFIAFNVTSSAVKGQGTQLVLVGTPVAYYDSNKDLIRLAFTVKNPSGETINVQGVIVNGTTINFANAISVTAGGTARIEVYWNNTKNAYNVTDGTNVYGTDVTSKIDVSGGVKAGYIEFVIISDKGTLTAVAQPLKT